MKTVGGFKWRVTSRDAFQRDNMFIDYGPGYYLNEEKFKTAMSAPAPPPNLEEVAAIQHRFRELHIDLIGRLQQTATPDPEAELQRYIEGLMAKYGK